MELSELYLQQHTSTFPATLSSLTAVTLPRFQSIPTQYRLFLTSLLARTDDDDTPLTLLN
jgi:hypothetical protein